MYINRIFMLVWSKDCYCLNSHILTSHILSTQWKGVISFTKLHILCNKLQICIQTSFSQPSSTNLFPSLRFPYLNKLSFWPHTQWMCMGVRWRRIYDKVAYLQGNTDKKIKDFTQWQHHERDRQTFGCNHAAPKTHGGWRELNWCEMLHAQLFINPWCDHKKKPFRYSATPSAVSVIRFLSGPLQTCSFSKIVHVLLIWKLSLICQCHSVSTPVLCYAWF